MNVFSDYSKVFNPKTSKYFNNHVSWCMNFIWLKQIKLCILKSLHNISITITRFKSYLCPKNIHFLDPIVSSKSKQTLNFRISTNYWSKIEWLYVYQIIEVLYFNDFNSADSEDNFNFRIFVTGDLMKTVGITSKINGFKRSLKENNERKMAFFADRKIGVRPNTFWSRIKIRIPLAIDFRDIFQTLNFW